MTRAELLARAAQQGHAVTGAQLRRWRGNGLLHAPHKAGRGRGEGVEASYDESHLAQVIAVATMLRENKSVDRALWRLWWQGFAVDDHAILAQLRTTLRDIDQTRRQVESIEQSDRKSKAFERTTQARLKDAGLAHMRRRIGKARFTSLMYVLPSLVTGRYAGLDSENAALVLHALGLIDKPDATLAANFEAAGFLRVLTPFFSHERLSAGLKDLDVATLRATRDAMRIFLPVIFAILDGQTAVQHPIAQSADRNMVRQLVAPLVADPPRFLFLALLGTRIYPQFEKALALLRVSPSLLLGGLAPQLNHLEVIE